MPTKQGPKLQTRPSPEIAIQNGREPERKTKQALLLEIISRDGGASLEELTSATGWLPHTVRSAITGLRKRGHDVQCQRTDGTRRYTIGSHGK